MLRKLSLCALLATALAVAFVLGQATNVPTASASQRGRVFVARRGDVIQIPGAATKCAASVEGGFSNLGCDHSPRPGRYTVVFYSDEVLVFRGPDKTVFSARWKP